MMMMIDSGRRLLSFSSVYKIYIENICDVRVCRRERERARGKKKNGTVFS
jgi:hypothetical protein